VLAGSRWRQPTGSPCIYELTESADRHEVLVEPEVTYRRWGCFITRTGPRIGVIVRPIELSYSPAVAAGRPSWFPMTRRGA
jgi:hypothetical protein